MGDKFVLAFRSNADVGDCKALPELDQARLREKIGRRRLSEKVDGEIDGDRKRHPSNGHKDRDIRRKIRQRHHGRARDRPAGPQRSFAKALTDAAPSKPDLFDAIAALRVEHLRKFVAEQALKLRNRQFRPLLHGPAPRAADRIQCASGLANRLANPHFGTRT